MDIDRIAPTRRPEGRPAQHQRWLDLLFLHWAVPVEVLRALVPASLEIDTFEGVAYVGVVPFTMRDVHPRWAFPVPGISHFHETNVRTYVHRAGRDPGVWFFSLDAANALAVWIARTFWHLPYHHATMSLSRKEHDITYGTSRRGDPGARCAVRYRPQGSPRAAEPGTLEHFLAERYILYAGLPDGSMRLGRVHHTPYPLEQVELHGWDEGLLAAAGIPRGAETPSALYAAGVSVEVFDLERIP